MWINPASVARCHGKIGYWNPRKAEDRAKKATEKSGEWIIAYECPDCGLWHIGHPDPCQFALLKQRLCKGCRESIPDGREGKFCTDQCKLDHVARKANAVMLCGEEMYVPPKPPPLPVPVPYIKTGHTVMPEIGHRPAYEPSIDLSEIKLYTRGAITKQEKKEKQNNDQENNFSTSHVPTDLLGVKFGLFTVVRRIKGKWEAKCICGTVENRYSKAILNPANSFDACIECRKPLGELRSKTYRETGVEISWEDCFQQIYGETEELCKSMVKSTKSVSTQEQDETCL